MQMRAVLAASLIAALAACSGYSPTSPTANGGGTGGNGGYGGGAGGGAGGGGTASGDVAVIVGNNFMKSAHNGTTNPAVDTVAVGGSVTWTWTNTASVPHGIQSLGTPLFRNSTVLTGSGQTYRVTFNAAGTYQYDCIVHGSMMTGTIVVR